MMRINDLQPCALCGGKIAPLFYEVTIQQHMIDAREVNKLTGLNAMLGGKAESWAIAQSLSPVTEVTIPLANKTAILCQECAFGKHVLIQLWEQEDEQVQ